MNLRILGLNHHRIMKRSKRLNAILKRIIVSQCWWCMCIVYICVVGALFTMNTINPPIGPLGLMLSALRKWGEVGFFYIKY